MGRVCLLCATVLVCVAGWGLFPSFGIAAEKTKVSQSSPSASAAPSASSVSGASSGVKDSTPVHCPHLSSPTTFGQVQELVEQKNAEAMYCLGDLYDRGQVVAEDPLLAAQWIRSAADLGSVDGMIRYGEMLARGRGVLPDMKRAALWFRKAAERDHTEAQAYLGELYEEGKVVDKNMQEAAAWYARAALKKHPVAQTRLGLMFSEGRGVKKDVGSATLLLYEAALQGQEEAIRALQTLAQPAARHDGALLLGLALDKMKREDVRLALQRQDITRVREDNAFVCDIYNISQSMPGATLMAACYAQDAAASLALVKIDYPTADKGQAESIRNALEDRFGPPTAREGDYSLLWNFGKVVVVGQYVPTAMETSLIYILPESYGALPQKNTALSGDTGIQLP